MARPARLSSTLRTIAERTERRASRLNSSVSIPMGNAPTSHFRSAAWYADGAAPLQAAFMLEVAGTIRCVVLGLKSNQVVGAQLRYEPFMVGQCGENLGRRKGNVQEKSNAVAMSALAQHLRQRNEMVVVHPDDIVGLQQLVQLVCEMHIDPQVAAEVAAREFGEVEPVVQDRPQHAVGEAVVVFLVVLLGEVGHHVAQAALVMVLVARSSIRGDRSAPAEPEAAVLLEQGAHGHRETAGLAAAVGVRDGDPVRDHDQPRQYRSSQLRDSRIALKIMPAIE